jgi:hypothetical protein
VKNWIGRGCEAEAVDGSRCWQQALKEWFTTTFISSVGPLRAESLNVRFAAYDQRILIGFGLSSFGDVRHLRKSRSFAAPSVRRIRIGKATGVDSLFTAYDVCGICPADIEWMGIVEEKRNAIPEEKEICERAPKR